MSRTVARRGHVELTAEQLEQPTEQPAASTVHTAGSAQLSHGLPVADTRAPDPGAVTVSYASRVKKIRVRLSQRFRRSSRPPGLTVVLCRYFVARTLARN